MFNKGSKMAIWSAAVETGSWILGAAVMTWPGWELKARKTCQLTFWRLRSEVRVPAGNGDSSPQLVLCHSSHWLHRHTAVHPPPSMSVSKFPRVIWPPITRSGPPSWPHLYPADSAKILFPCKATFWGNGGLDVNIPSLRGYTQLNINSCWYGRGVSLDKNFTSQN